MYSEQTFPWITGETLEKRTNIPLASQDFVLEESSWVNLSLGISIVASMEQMPGLDPFLHVSVHNARRDVTMDELRYIKRFFFGYDSFVKVVPTRYSKSQHRTFHLTESTLEDSLGVSKN